MKKLPQKSTTVRPQVQAPKDISQYLQDLDALLKRNTGSGLYVGQDVSSNTPMYIPGKVQNPGGIGESAPSISQYGNGMTAPSPVQRQAIIPEQPQEQPTQDSGISQLEQFIQQFNESVYPTQFGVTTPIQSNGIATLSDGGILGQDGVVRYSDGTQREYRDSNAQGIASLQDGSIQYSDGTVRRKAPQGIASLNGPRERILMDDGTAQYGAYSPNFSPNVLPGGLQGLVSGIFGQDRTITQPYGNINPMEPTPGNVNYGTDIRTRDLTGSQRNLKLPVGATVVEVLRDDGTRFGTQSGHKGYGNSLLVQLPTGEMIRMSHLSNMIDVKPGDQIPAGTVFGTPGNTGNTTGEHLDLEYYDQNGQISNPSKFSAFSSPEAMRQNVEGQPAPGTQAPTGPMSASTQQITQPKAVQPPIQASFPKQRQGQVLGATATSLQPNPQEQNIKTANEIAGIGTALKAPELQTNELVQQQGTNPFRQLAGNVLDVASTPLKKIGLPDFGISEAVAGGRTINTDKNLAPGAFAYDDKGNPIGSKNPTPEDYANVLGTGIKEAGSYAGKQVGSALAKAGQGIQGLATTGISSLENVFKPEQIKEKRAIGDVPGTVDASGNPNFSSLLDTAGSKASNVKNDIRDSFFKQGGADIYKNFLNPNAVDNSGGALSLDLFNKDFFGDLGRITSVFGGSKDLNPAVEKYVQMEQQKYKPMERMGYQEGYDRGEIDNYNRQVDQYNNELNNYFNSIRKSAQGVPSSFTPNVPGSAKNIFSSSSPSSRVMASPTLNTTKVSGPVLASFNKPSVQAPVVSQPSQGFSSAQNFTPSNANTSTNRGPVYSAPPSQSRPAPSQAPKPQTFTPRNANTSTNRGPVYTAPPRASSPAPQSRPSSNIFSSVKSFINNIFRR